MAVVYRHIRLDKNEPFYIGIGRDEARAFSKKGRNRHWRFITTKSNYEIDIYLRIYLGSKLVRKKESL